MFLSSRSAYTSRAICLTASAAVGTPDRNENPAPNRITGQGTSVAVNRQMREDLFIDPIVAKGGLVARAYAFSHPDVHAAALKIDFHYRWGELDCPEFFGDRRARPGR